MSSADPWIPCDPFRAPPLAPGRVAVWRMPLPYPACESWGVTLPPADMERIDGAGHPAVRLRHRHTRIVLRVLRARYGGVAPADQADIPGEHGKPGCAVESLHFNLSHAETVALLAFSPDGAVGVDVEVPGRPRPFARLAARFFHPREQARWAEAGATEAAFLRLWTAKEALLKAAGLGISLALDQLDSTAVLDGGDWRGFRLTAVPPGLAGAGHLAGASGAADWFRCPD